MCTEHCAPGISRRNFAGLALAGAGLSLLPIRAQAAFKSDALCIMCIDPRTVYSAQRFFDDPPNPVGNGGLGMGGKYDMVALAGASLASVSLAFPTSIGAIWDHIDLAVKLHQIDKVIVMDHRDCGAFEAVYGKTSGAAELALHKKVMGEMKTEFNRRGLNRTLGVDFYLMPVFDPPRPPPAFLRPEKVTV
jgi:hypothetical protein